MKELILWLQQPENVAILAGIFLAFATALRVLGELFIAIGKLNPNPDKWDFHIRLFAMLHLNWKQTEKCLMVKLYLYTNEVSGLT